MERWLWRIGLAGAALTLSLIAFVFGSPLVEKPVSGNEGGLAFLLVILVLLTAPLSLAMLTLAGVYRAHRLAWPRLLLHSLEALFAILIWMTVRVLRGSLYVGWWADLAGACALVFANRFTRSVR